MDPNIHQAHRRDRRRRRLPAFILLAIVTVVIAGWIGLFAFLGSNSALGTIEGLEERFLCDTTDLDLSFPDVSRLSTVSTADGVELGKLAERNSRPVAIEDMPDLVIGALLSAEDRNFYHHRGVDFKAVARAAIGGARSGASTITQQVVKQNFLNADRTIERKICEAQIASELERRYTKDQILEFYANSVFFGSNAYGIQAAANEYFGKDLDELTLAEAATLVTPIRNPTFYHPRNNPQNSIKARNRTIDRMVENGYVTGAEGEAAKASPLGVVAHVNRKDLDPQVMIAVRQDLLNSDEYHLGDTYTERKHALFGCPAADTTCSGGGGLQIDITLDYDLQTEANRLLRDWFRPEYNGPTGAIATIENATGAIRVIASGVDYGDDIEAGQRPYDLATGGARNAGSAFKPFTLAAALENGDLEGHPITLASYWDRSSPVVIDCGFPCSPDGNTWTVDNAGGKGPHDLQTLESATYNSTNTVYARVIHAIGADVVVDVARRLGITSPYLKPYPAITLGAASVSPLEMAAAYSTFANYGERVEPYLIERITAADGTVVYEHEPHPVPVLSPAIASVVVSTLKEVVSKGTGRRANIDRPQAGKTGTATEYSDVWFMGFVPQLTTAVWVGYPDRPDPLREFTIWNPDEEKEQFVKRAYGGTVAGPVWKDFMEYATRDLPPIDFPPEPEGAEAYRITPRTEVPDLSGMTPEEMEVAVYGAGLRFELVEQPSPRPEGDVLSVEPSSGSALRQGSTVTVTVSSGIPTSLPTPDLLAIPVSEVAGELRKLEGKTGAHLNWEIEYSATPNPDLWGLVIATTPAPGVTIANNGTIRVLVGEEPSADESDGG